MMRHPEAFADFVKGKAESEAEQDEEIAGEATDR